MSQAPGSQASPPPAARGGPSSAGCTGKHGRTPPAETPPPIQRSSRSRWRALALTLVHVAIAIHVTHWYFADETIGPFEPSQAMKTLELGVINVGFIFLLTAVILTGIFGRFFCGWGCHVVALQDLCSTWMRKMGVRPKPFRSRLLIWVPAVAAFYMFAWPSVSPFFGFPEPASWGMDTWRAELMTSDPWSDFESWAVAIPFLLLCGFLTVYLLGNKAYCTYACPYGALFSAADRVAPGRIEANLSACEKCGHCTASCSSNVRVHEEIQVYGRVMDSGCMKCMDCVSVCPNDVLSFRFGKPSLLVGRREGHDAPRKRYDLSWPQELGLLGVFVATFFLTRGLYHWIPMLMALGVAGCVTFIAYRNLGYRSSKRVTMSGLVLRRDGKNTRAGRVFRLISLGLLAFLVHTGVYRALVWKGDRSFEAVRVPLASLVEGGTADGSEREAARRSLVSYRQAQGLGLVKLLDLEERLFYLELAVGEREEAARRVERVMKRRLDGAHGPSSPEKLREVAAQLRIGEGNLGAALEIYRHWLERRPGDALAHHQVAALHLARGDMDSATAAMRRAVQADPDNPEYRQKLRALEDAGG